MANRTYEIIDEPVPSSFSGYAANPLWPLLSMMLVSSWVAWIWFVMNGFAMGSPTRIREASVAAIGCIIALAIALTLSYWRASELLSLHNYRYSMILLVTWKLGIAYYLYILQSRCFGLYEYFGGAVKIGGKAFIAVFLIEPFVSRKLPMPDWISLALN